MKRPIANRPQVDNLPYSYRASLSERRNNASKSLGSVVERAFDYFQIPRRMRGSQTTLF